MSNLSVKAINQLRQSARSVVRELGLLNDAYFDIGVTLAERHLLIELNVCGYPTMGEVADRLLLDKSTISRLIAKAVKKGYVACITDEKDKRRRFLQLTEKGRSTLNAFEPIAFNQTKEALLTLTNDEVEVVYRGLELYARSLKQSRLRTNKKGAPAPVDKLKEGLPEIVKHLKGLGYYLEPFHEKDEDGLYDIFQEVVDSGMQFPYESSSRDEFRRQFFGPHSQVYVCRNVKDEVVGGFYLKPNYTGRSKHIANAAYMMRSTHRGQGIGSQLVKASLHLAKDLGFHAMQFNMVLSKNVGATRLYERLGFSIVGTIPQAVRNVDGSYQDGYVMYYNLNNL